MNQQQPPSALVAVTKRVDREEDLLVFGRHVPRNDNDDNATAIPSATTTSYSSFVGDTMTQLVDDALKKGVASLPLLHHQHNTNNNNNTDNDTNTNPAEAALIQKLKDVYYQNIDVLEIYADDHVFSLDMYPPTRRQQIVQTFLQEQQQQQDLTKATMKGTNQSSDTPNGEGKVAAGAKDDFDTNHEEPMTDYNALDDGDIPIVSFPSPEDVPSPEQMEALAEENKQLRAKLQQLKLEHSKWLVKCNVLEQVQANTEQVAQAMQASTEVATTAIDQSVTAVIMGKQGLEQLHARAVDLLQELDDKKQQQQQQQQPRRMLPGADPTFVGGLGKENRSKKPRLSFAPEKVIQQSRALLHATPEGRDRLHSLIRESNE